VAHVSAVASARLRARHGHCSLVVPELVVAEAVGCSRRALRSTATRTRSSGSSELTCATTVRARSTAESRPAHPLRDRSGAWSAYLTCLARRMSAIRSIASGPGCGRSPWARRGDCTEAPESGLYGSLVFGQTSAKAAGGFQGRTTHAGREWKRGPPIQGSPLLREGHREPRTCGRREARSKNEGSRLPNPARLCKWAEEQPSGMCRDTDQISGIVKQDHPP
jgi:hypothetical protein